MWLHRQFVRSVGDGALNGYAEVETLKVPGWVQLPMPGGMKTDLSGLFDDSAQPAS